MLYVMPFLLAMVVTMAWLPVFGRVAARWGIVDRPGHRKVHITPIPRVGGLGSYVVGLTYLGIVAYWLQDGSRRKQKTLALLDRALNFGSQVLKKGRWEW